MKKMVIATTLVLVLAAAGSAAAGLVDMRTGLPIEKPKPYPKSKVSVIDYVNPNGGRVARGYCIDGLKFIHDGKELRQLYKPGLFGRQPVTCE